MTPTFVDELEFGFGWLEGGSFMRRCSHALAVEGRVWILDAVADDEAIERVRGLGEPAGVVQLLDRHNRDNAAIAERLGVPLHFVPESAPDGAPFEVVPLLRNRIWREVALWFPSLRTLVVAEAVGTAQFYVAPQERVGVSPVLRLTPPRRLLAYEPDHLLVGHGEGVHEDAVGALRDGILHARERLPAWLWAGFRAHGPGGTHTRRRRSG
ncbi:MAG TPA: hypothetical protein VLW49_10365 [Gaiellaceae bacterium]|nr:hypothetical protein [Gaiellaceae bacterium]